MIRTIAFLVFIFGVFIFGMAYHNIDLAVNAAAGSLDINGWGYQQDKTKMYQNGMSGLTVSVVMLIGAFVALLDDNDGKMAKLSKKDVQP